MPRVRDHAATDGRHQRSARSREQILPALRELVGEGNLQPTGQQIAERADVSLRTVFRHFEDMEGLFREMHTWLEQTLAPLAGAPQLEGTLAERIEALVQRRARVFEKASPYLRSGALSRWRSRFLMQLYADGQRDMRADLLLALPELGELDDASRAAAEAVASFEGWDRLRTSQGLGRARAEQAVRAALEALLASRRGR